MSADLETADTDLQVCLNLQSLHLQTHTIGECLRCECKEMHGNINTPQWTTIQCRGRWDNPCGFDHPKIIKFTSYSLISSSPRLFKELNQATDDDVSLAFDMLLLKIIRIFNSREQYSTQMQTITYREYKLLTAFCVVKCIRSVQHKYISIISI